MMSLPVKPRYICRLFLPCFLSLSYGIIEVFAYANCFNSYQVNVLYKFNLNFCIYVYR